MSGCPFEGQPEDHLVHRALLLWLILTNSDRRAEAPKRGQDHRSHPSRCLVGRLCPPDNLQVLIDFLSSLFPPPACSAPGTTRRFGAQNKDMDQQAGTGPSEEVNLEEGIEGKQNRHTGDYLLTLLVTALVPSMDCRPFGHMKATTNTINGYCLPALSPEFGVHGWHCGAVSKFT